MHPLPFPSPLSPAHFCVTHWGIRVIAFVLKQASTHVCRFFKTMECKQIHAMFLRCQQEKGPWFNGFWWKGDPRCFQKLSGHADLILAPASKHSVCFWKIGITSTSLHGWWERLKWTNKSRSTFSHAFLRPSLTKWSLHYLFQRGPHCKRDWPWWNVITGALSSFSACPHSSWCPLTIYPSLSFSPPGPLVTSCSGVPIWSSFCFDKWNLGWKQ